MSSRSSVHAEILANLLYVTVGFSLVVVLSRSLGSVKTLGQLWETMVSFAALVTPTALFLFYIKTYRRGSQITLPLLVLDYLFVFFVSAYAFSLTPEGRTAEITIMEIKLSLTSLSLVVMFGYPVCLQVLSLRKMLPGGIREVIRGLFIKPHTRDEIREINMLFFLCALIAMVIGSIWVSVLIMTSMVQLVFFSDPNGLGLIRESKRRTFVAFVLMITLWISTMVLLKAGMDNGALSVIIGFWALPLIGLRILRRRTN